MIQKGDDLINGAGCSQQQSYLYHQNVVNSQRNDIGSRQLVQAMSFEDLLSQGEVTLPSVETVLPHYAIAIPTPPPSVPSPSVNMTINNTTTTNTTSTMNVTEHQDFQLQHLTPQHYATPVNNLQHQPVGAPFHPIPSAAVEFNYHMLNTNNGHTNIASTSGGQQLLVDDNKPEYLVEQRQPKIESVENDSIYVSDASTVDIDENLVDEPFTYLQNLNSDNLMKFSQQSALQQLIDEQVLEPKLNTNLLPTCEEHDIGGYDFQINVNIFDLNATRPGIAYSKDSQRLYVKTNENVYIDCSYQVKMPIKPLHVRVFAVYTKDTGEPVLRCQNHISKDVETNEIIRNSLVRCQNPDAIYRGSNAGKSICDRYSVLIPLNASVKVNDSNNHLKQQLIINFTCNNSCMNRRQTMMVFVLEGMNGEILGQRVLDVKISTCPKRDKKLYDGMCGRKRRPLAEPEFPGSSPKIAKHDESCTKEDISRSSFEEASEDDASRNASINGNGVPPTDDIVKVKQERNSGEFVLTLRYKHRQQMLQTLRVLYSNSIANEVFYDIPTTKELQCRESELLKEAYERVWRMKNRIAGNPRKYP